MTLLLLKTFDCEGPRGRLVLVFLGELMDVGAVPVPLLPMCSGSRTDRTIRGPFRGSILAIFLSAQSAKRCLLFIITRTWRCEVVRRKLPKGEVKCRTGAEIESENDRVPAWDTLVRRQKNSPDCLDCTRRSDLLHIIEQCSKLRKPLRFLRLRGGKFNRVHDDILRLFRSRCRVLC